MVDACDLKNVVAYGYNKLLGSLATKFRLWPLEMIVKYVNALLVRSMPGQLDKIHETLITRSITLSNLKKR